MMYCYVVYVYGLFYFCIIDYKRLNISKLPMIYKYLTGLKASQLVII